MSHSTGKSGAAFPRHFDGKRYYNPEGDLARGFVDVIRWKLTSRAQTSPRFVSDVISTVPPPVVERGTLRATFVNHSTVLLQQHGCNILTDPIWSGRASPVTWAGPRRHRAPGVVLEDLPQIDAVLLSHNHYDHVDLPTLRLIAARGCSTFVVPSGLGRLFREESIATAQELDWNDSLAFPGFTVHCVPAQHFSGRSPFDWNRTLWCGYLIETEGRIVYFAGDTAFGSHFARIRQLYGAPDLALLPIGAYEPRWFMSPMHMNPEDAVRAHQILGAKTSIGIHHGTFQLSDESIDSPRAQLLQCASRGDFRALHNGEFIEIS